MAPTLRTDRLVLRAHRRSDFDAYAAIFASDRSVHMGGPLDRDAAWGSFCADVAGWALNGFGAWAIERASDGQLIGQVALQHPPRFPERELGWMLFDGFEGQGFACEAATAARDFAFDTLGWSDCVSYISPENAPSIRLAQAMGARRDETAPVPVAHDLVYRHIAPGGTA
ncbi:GNAT family N-acetyltransferase [Roseobacter sp. HKCCA0434]|uniref:GNAT family N-acetyltransferase n=1 Tax=Roseobacter sp. HKCCA0434 TaxID=3079297 RepID=UPI0029057DB3|nr:GNAT family N-acetyltransferase [Roseobacter sp. HKCCA0434]